MFTSTRNFIKRHRTNLAVGFGIVGAGYLAVHYIGNKLSEARSQLMSDRQAKEKYVYCPLYCSYPAEGFPKAVEGTPARKLWMRSMDLAYERTITDTTPASTAVSKPTNPTVPTQSSPFSPP
jgi:hypothetical protein